MGKSSAAARLKQARLKITPARLAVITGLDKQAKPIGADELWLKLKSRFNRVTIYRTLDMFENKDLVRSVDIGHGHLDYELNNPDDHHHHLICDNCGDIADMALTNEARMIQQLERRHKFKTRTHAFEFFGLCRNCAQPP